MLGFKNKYKPLLQLEPNLAIFNKCLFPQVLVEQGLGKFVDPDFVRYTSREMQEALDMTQEEMDRAAHRLLLQERQGRPLSFEPPEDTTGDVDPRL